MTAKSITSWLMIGLAFVTAFIVLPLYIFLIIVGVAVFLSLLFVFLIIKIVSEICQDEDMAENY